MIKAQNIILKMLKTAFYTAVMALLPLFSLSAQEITAIDFNGDILGKVIPDGKVVGFNNQLIGNVTADSLILNFDGDLIGGVVPQGVAIGNDNQLLGKVNNDGSVRIASGKVVGKVLPNGLVVDDYFNIIGAVLFPGLVYSDEGKTVGRLTGDGLYTDLKGQQIGFISPDGYAYRRVGTDYVLDGRLISSKMVVSLNGDFIGSVVPGGEVSDFESRIIGRIKANGFAYDENNRIIGRIVRSGYAFDNFGLYLGFVTYNGEVVNKDSLVGRQRADGRIVSPDGALIGFTVDIAATATDLNGRYLGRLIPGGDLARAREMTALVGARGLIHDSSGKTVGRLVITGPYFDEKGALKLHALSNGSAVALSGSPLGFVKGGEAYDFSGKALAAAMGQRLVIGENNQILGLPGINGVLAASEDKRRVSPYGYVYSAEGSLSGRSLSLAPLYGQNGLLLAEVGLNGEVIGSGGQNLGRLTQSGVAFDERNQFLGKNIPDFYALDAMGTSLGNLSETNLVLDNNLAVSGRLLPGHAVIPSDGGNQTMLMPEIGRSYNRPLALNFNGDLLGYVGVDGTVKDFSGAVIAKVVDNGLLLDNYNNLSGFTASYTTVVNDTCSVQGTITPRGEVSNYRGVYMGRLLGNGQVVAGNDLISGFAVDLQPVIDNNGSLLGAVTADGRVLNMADQDLGCIDYRGQLRNPDGAVVGKIVETDPVIDFSGNIIGRIQADGKFINEESAAIGYLQPNDNVNSSTGNPLGQLFKYRVAFDNDNKYMGRVLRNAIVVDRENKEVGRVDFDGFVLRGGQKIGYALYDMYLYNGEGKAVGYLSSEGDVLGFSNQKLGMLDRGFMLDRAGSVIARGNRDFYIRDKEHRVVGYLNLNGDVVDAAGKLVGTLGEAGEIKNGEGTLLAVATPLQYYSKLASTASYPLVVDADGKTVGRLDENGNVIDKNNKIIGFRDKAGRLVDSLNNLIGRFLNNDPVYDQDGNVIGTVKADGTVVDANGKVIGRLDENGNVIDANGNIIGGIGANWYQKAPVKSEPREEDLPDIGILGEEKYRRALGVALTPDGEYLGDILEDGTVVDKNGNYLGRRMPDGLIMDNDGNLIGIEEVKKPDSSGMFVPPGTFGAGGAYGTGNGAGGNLGPGGGYGPGERYDPARAAALSAAQNQRRQNISVGKISSGVRKEAFDGMQKDWSEQGIAKAISSWRVDLSEMIFADKPIPAVIARSIDSNNPSPITAFVERNVYAEEGRNVIIPAGSRLIGTLGSVSASTEATSESARVQITWERLIRPDGSLFVFQGLTADAQGRGGALGYVDQQLFKKYTLPVMTTSLTSATSYYMAPSENSDTSTETPRQQAANDARQNFLNEMNKVFDEILADKSNIKPMTYVPAGTRIIVYPNTDLWLRTYERDQDEAEARNLEKPEVLIDQKALARKNKQEDTELRQRLASPPAGGDVVYETDSEPVTPLMSSSSSKNKTTAPAAAPTAVAPVYTPPPPPSASASGSSQTSGNNSDSESSVPALF